MFPSFYSFKKYFDINKDTNVGNASYKIPGIFSSLQMFIVINNENININGDMSPISYCYYIPSERFSSRDCYIIIEAEYNNETYYIKYKITKTNNENYEIINSNALKIVEDVSVLNTSNVWVKEEDDIELKNLFARQLYDPSVQ